MTVKSRTEKRSDLSIPQRVTALEYDADAADSANESTNTRLSEELASLRRAIIGSAIGFGASSIVYAITSFVVFGR